ncbi:MSMEG_0568 family radical SAM protein [Spirosoma rhododendri]|uniref:MSMEG_0568 family radical SAM protein n=1 Tax=Spirosoma rhododendri TaxID=2728024 RepID=A0A7L5DP29_9BACT|nr:MSMEG_0568 family radical SAM protein [Spirosoma rhododendri]QJD80146.1 MSMEG_0568 family radical SAM protein [Spirosoma rhododendri]
MLSEELLTELQTMGLRLDDLVAGTTPARRGGAGPTDHKAVRIAGTTLMVPVYNQSSGSSPYHAGAPNVLGVADLLRNGEKLGLISFPRQPNFYSHTTTDGVPFWKIAQLHSHNVLATTLLQNCIRYGDSSTSCQFCAIGESLKYGTTIAYKKPLQLAEVTRVAVEQDGIEQLVITTGTPATKDRGAKILRDTVAVLREQGITIPIQVQCEPPDDFSWFAKLRDAGVDTLGMHLEAAGQAVREQIMPGKAEVPLDYYMDAFRAAVAVFGRAQVSTYLLAGLGDSVDALVDLSRELITIGVYPFVVPFVPVRNTPLQNHPSPSPVFMKAVLGPVGQMLAEAGMTADTIKAGCGKCGACSTLKSFEKLNAAAVC